jgi:hypothetical protein
MEYRRDLSSIPQHEVRFYGVEISLLKLVFTELIVLKEQKGNSDLIVGLDRKMANVDLHAAEMVQKIERPEYIAETLEDFEARTDEQVREIAFLPVAAFENTSVLRRRDLGLLAGQLALEYRKLLADYEIPEDDQVAELMRDLDNGIPE